MPRNLAFVAALLLIQIGLFPNQLAAQSMTDAAMDIQAKLDAGDTAGALDTARSVVAHVWDASPGLGFTEAMLVAAPATGYGIFNPRETNIFKPGESIVLYAEPYGFAYGSDSEGIYSIGFHVDLQVLNQMGEVLGDVPDVTELNLISRRQNREFQANITYDLSGLAPGQYRLVTTLRDKNSAKSGSFETEIEITE